MPAIDPALADCPDTYDDLQDSVPFQVSDCRMAAEPPIRCQVFQYYRKVGNLGAVLLEGVYPHINRVASGEYDLQILILVYVGNGNSMDGGKRIGIIVRSQPQVAINIPNIDSTLGRTRRRIAAPGSRPGYDFILAVPIQISHRQRWETRVAGICCEGKKPVVSGDYG